MYYLSFDVMIQPVILKELTCTISLGLLCRLSNKYCPREIFGTFDIGSL